MDSLEFDGQVYVSTKRAAEITGYAKDYVGQLCREGRVTARLVGRSWYVSESSIKEHRFGAEAVAEETEVQEPIEEPKEEVAEQIVEEKEIKTAQYVTEEVTPLPSLEDEKETGETTPVESAWKEWFDTRKPEPKEVKEEVVTEVIQDIAPAPIKIERVEQKIEVHKIAPKVKASRQGSLSRSTASAVLIGFILITISATLLITGSVEKYVEKAPISGALMYLGGTSFIK